MPHTDSHSAPGTFAGSYTLASLAGSLGYSYGQLSRLAARIPRHGYDQFADERGRRARIISAPAPWLRELQRNLVDGALSTVALHEAVFSQRGRSVIECAQQHIGQSHMVVMDVRDCFPSITQAAIRVALEKCGFRSEVARLITRLTTHNGRLPQGPPSSPAILNLVFADVDVQLASLAADNAARYTRYMDDICFSANQPIDTLRRKAVRLLKSRGFRINSRKLKTYGPEDVHIVTKIIVGPTSLHAMPAYVREVNLAISAYGRGSKDASAVSLQSMVHWVESLNASQGAVLGDNFAAAKLQRSSRRR